MGITKGWVSSCVMLCSALFFDCGSFCLCPSSLWRADKSAFLLHLNTKFILDTSACVSCQYTLVSRYHWQPYLPTLFYRSLGLGSSDILWPGLIWPVCFWGRLMVCTLWWTLCIYSLFFGMFRNLASLIISTISADLTHMESSKFKCHTWNQYQVFKFKVG